LPYNNVATNGTVERLSGSQSTSNTPSNPNAIAPVTSTISTGKTFDYQAPGFSVSVITVTAQ
jgi:alpha-N-arabinofuranosidase